LGKPLTEKLNSHPFTKIVYTESRGKGAKGNLVEAEAVFFALPHGESEKYLKKIGNKKIIDLSIDHRDDNGWTYGLAEIFQEKIKKAVHVANPGCYATSVLLGVYPLKGKIESLRIASTSGISGAGMAASKDDNFLVYKEGKEHSQLKEIEKILGLDDIVFVPQRIDTAEKGIISTMFVQADDLKKLPKIFAETYKECPFVRIKNEIETKNVIGTNFCDIKILELGKNVLIITALDNLMKGGAGQAIQNFNLMYGLEETLGLI